MRRQNPATILRTVWLSLCASLFNGCLHFHAVDPPLSLETKSVSSKCVSTIRFMTRVDGLPPDIETKDGNFKISPDRENGHPSAALDELATSVFSESNILVASDRNGIDVEHGIFFQISDQITIPSLGYASLIFSSMLLTLIPGHAVIQEKIVIQVFENRQFLFRKSYSHSISQWQWLPLAFFFWMDEGTQTGKELFSAALREAIQELILRKEVNGRCVN